MVLPDLSSQESQFVSQSGDEDNLWEIVGILAEKRGQYKVKWAGEDPKTGKPWGNSWVPKSDVTPDVAKEWKEKRANKQRKKSLSKAPKQPSDSTSSTLRRGRSSVATTAKPEQRSPSPSVLHTVPPPSPPLVLPGTLKTNGKRKQYVSMAASSDEEDLPASIFEHEPTPPVEPLKKKRKIGKEAEGLPKHISNLKPTARSDKPTLGYHELEKKGEEQPQIAEMQDGDVDEEDEEELVPRPPPKRRKPARLGVKPSATETGLANTTTRKGKGRETDPAILPQLHDRDYGHAQPEKMFIESVMSDDIEDEGPAVQKPRSKLNGAPSKAPKADLAKRKSYEENESERNVVTAKPKPKPKVKSSISKPAPAPRYITPNTRQSAEHSLGSDHPLPLSPCDESDIEPVVRSILHPGENGKPGLARTEPKSKVIGIHRQSTHPHVLSGIVERPEIQGSPPHIPGSIPIPTTPSRLSLISKMKPRTPRSAAASKDDLQDETSRIQSDLIPTGTFNRPSEKARGGASKPKPLRPIPQISPSAFHPHLPSALIGSTFEDDDEDPPTSSIEQFDSPEKKTQYRVVAISAKSKGKEKALQGHEPGHWSDDAVAERGKRIAERAKAKAGNQWRESNLPRRPLEDILKKHRSSSRAASNRLVDSSLPSSPPAPQEMNSIEDEWATKTEGDVETRDYAGPSDFGQHQLLHSSVNEDDFYVDDATMTQDTQMDDGHFVPPRFLPQEDEETTQDLIYEMEIRRAMSEGVDYQSSSPVREPEIEQQNGSADITDIGINVSTEPQPGTLPDVLDSGCTDEVTKNETLLRSRASSQGTAPARVKPSGLEETQEIPATAPTLEEFPQQSNETDRSNDSTDPKEHIRYMTLLNAKSEEIRDLGTQLGEVRTKNEEFARQVAALQEQLRVAQDSAQTGNRQSDILLQKYQALEEQLSESNLKLQATNRTWEARAEALGEEVMKQKSLYEVTERHLEDIKVLHGEETGRCAVLKKSKKRLEEELDISRSQASEGVKCVREMLDKRLKDMEEDRNRWRNAAQFIMDKDARTNDDIRRRAAEEPEIRAKCQQYKLKYSALRAKVEDLEEQIENLLEEETEEVKRLRREVQELRLGRRRSLSASLRDGHSPLEFHPRNSVSHGEGLRSQEEPMERAYPEEEVFRCEWRLDDDKFCNAIFISKIELGEHIFASGHVLRPESPVDELD